MCIRFALLWICVVTASQSIVAQDGGPDANTEPEAIWRRYSSAVALAHTVTGSATDRAFELIKVPVFVHNNNVRYESHALVYFWVTPKKRPVAAFTCILLKEAEGHWKEINEYHSFHNATIKAACPGRYGWTPKGPGVDWVEIPDSPDPASSGKSQLIQAKRLSARFTVNANYGPNDKWELRRFPSPVHQYSTVEDDSGAAVSGIVNVFCRDNDPEAMLLLEVQENAAGKYRWHYAPVNFTNAGPHMFLDGEEIWNDDPATFGAAYRHFGYSPNSKLNLEAELPRLTK